jgi:hypothetical protein
MFGLAETDRLPLYGSATAARCCGQNSVMTDAVVSAALNDDGFDYAQLVVNGAS